jgi:hypothetical protein
MTTKTDKRYREMMRTRPVKALLSARWIRKNTTTTGKGYSVMHKKKNG